MRVILTSSLLLVLIVLTGCFGIGQSRSVAQTFSEAEQRLVAEHVYGGIPPGDQVLVRHAYVLAFDVERRVAAWVAYRIVPSYLKTPPRDGPFDGFRSDPDLPNPVVDGDYDGLFSAWGFARGHLVPYAVSGGDRDGDGLYAIVDLNGDGEFTADDENADGDYVIADDYEAETVYQVNYMSNIAPQDHYNFNGAGGLWYELERWIQDDLVEARHQEVWVIAGTVFGSGEVQKVGPAGDIHVPPMFFKIVIFKAGEGSVVSVLAFLFPHQRESHGQIEDFLVSIDTIESLVGRDFFSADDDGIDIAEESQDSWLIWQNLGL